MPACTSMMKQGEKMLYPQIEKSKFCGVAHRNFEHLFQILYDSITELIYEK